MFPKAQCPPLTRSPPDHTLPSQTHALIFFFFTWVRDDQYIRPVLGREGGVGQDGRPVHALTHRYTTAYKVSAKTPAWSAQLTDHTSPL